MFTRTTFSFLDQLTDHNTREWFAAHKADYEAAVREPAQRFIMAMAPALAGFAPHFRADPRKMGGSLMRVYRDTRFSRDKTPYKTNVGIQFRHALGRDVHAPGFYLHLATDECFLGAGCWHPDPAALEQIRRKIADDPERWFAVRDDAAFRQYWTLTGDSLSRPPRGYPADHPAIEDLKRKDFVALAALQHAEALAPDLADFVATRFAAAAPLMAFLCAAAGVPY